VSSLASLDGHRLAVMVWHYHDDDVAGPDADVSINLSGVPVDEGTAHVAEYRIDETHSNAYTAWKKMGSPQQPSETQINELTKAGQLALAGKSEIRFEGHHATIRTVLPRQAVSLFVVEW